jgi:hypothetical protein
MPFIGNKPSAVPLTSADIADSIITSAKIADGTIVNADINASAAIVATKLSGIGKVLQVVQATDQTSRSTTSTSFVTGSNTLSVAITPSSASNKILIYVSHYAYNDGANNCSATIFRDATNLGGTNGFGQMSSGSGIVDLNMSYNFLDSPNTTSSTTYQVYFKTTNAITTSYICNGNLKATIIVMEIAG